MASPERGDIAPLGEQVVKSLVKISLEARNQETVLALGDGLNIRANVIAEINDIINKCTP